MNEKILQALKTKYKNLGFGEKAFQGVSEYLGTTIKEEKDIETAIAGVESLLKSFQSDADRVRTENAQMKAKIEELSKQSQGQQQQQTQQPDDTPAWAKSFVSQVESLNKEIAQLKTGQVIQNRKTVLEAKLKDANPLFSAKIMKDFARMNFSNDAEFETYLTETEADLTAFNQDLANQGLLANGKPIKTTQNGDNAGVDFAKQAAASKNTGTFEGVKGKAI